MFCAYSGCLNRSFNILDLQLKMDCTNPGSDIGIQVIEDIIQQHKRNEFYFQVAKTTRENKIHIFKLLCSFLFYIGV